MTKNEKRCMIFFIMVIGVSLIHEFVKDVTAHGILLGIIGFIPTIIMPIMVISVYQLLEKNKKEVIVYSEEEKCIRAYHQAGHAVIAAKLRSVDKIKKLSILPEDNNIPISMMLEIEVLTTKTTDSEAEELLLMILGGRAAERVVVNNTFKTSDDDLKEATDFVIGIMRIVYQIEEEFEWQKMLEELEDKAVKLLKENRKLLDRIAQELMEKEVVFADDIEYIMMESIINKNE